MNTTAPYEGNEPIRTNAAAPSVSPEEPVTKTAGDAPALPANATAADVRRWLREIEDKELEVKRADHLERLRPARSKFVEELYAYYVVPPLAGDRGEKERLAQLRKRLALDDGPVAKPGYLDDEKWREWGREALRFKKS